MEREPIPIKEDLIDSEGLTQFIEGEINMDQIQSKAKDWTFDVLKRPDFP